MIKISDYKFGEILLGVISISANILSKLIMSLDFSVSVACMAITILCLIGFEVCLLLRVKLKDCTTYYSYKSNAIVIGSVMLTNLIYMLFDKV